MKWNFEGKQDVYLEVAQRMREFILKGVYKKSEALPSVRAAAAEMGVNPNTVQKAYALLEKEGLIAVQPKKGAFVRQDQPKKNARSSEQDVKMILAEIKNEGVTMETLVKWIGEVYGDD